MPDIQRTCNHCGRPLTSSGRRSANGIYYCRAAECQRVKARANYRLTVGAPEEKQAPTICANPQCGAPLKPRLIRAGDSVLGRWCDRAACRRHKAAVLAHGSGANQADFEVQRDVINMLAVAVNQPRVTCPECGVDDAVVTYWHPTPDGAPCPGVGRKKARGEAILVIWGARLGTPHPAMLALAEELIAAESRPQEVHPA